jgi:hypothetical protein
MATDREVRIAGVANGRIANAANLNPGSGGGWLRHLRTKRTDRTV